MIPLLDELTKPGVAYSEKLEGVLFSFMKLDGRLRSVVASAPEAFQGIVLPELGPDVLKFRKVVYDDVVQDTFKIAVLTLPSVLSQLKSVAESLEDQSKKTGPIPSASEFILACAGNAL